jgi:3-oxoacyl-[acyl-carrier-protein] synthase III
MGHHQVDAAGSEVVPREDACARLFRSGVPEEKVVINIEKFGNTTAATIPLALSDAVDAKRLKRGDTLLMVSVGAGFTVGALLIKWGLK